MRKPLIQIHARPLGQVEWVCPHCSSIHGRVRLNFRNGKLRCRHCRRYTYVGMAFTEKPTRLVAPYNAVYIESQDAFNRYVVNAYPNVPEGRPAIARVVGHIQWQCPNCRRFADKGQHVQWDDTSVTCYYCDAKLYVTALLYRPPNSWRRTPYDWAPPDQYETPYKTSNPADPTPPAEAHGETV